MAGSIQGPERRIVLVDKIISGKSAAGNTILGSKVFESGRSPNSITAACQKEEAQLTGRKVVIVDTPGFFYTHRPGKEIAAQVKRCIKFCSPSPHVILHVMHPFHAPQETDVVQLIKKIFGRNAKDYTIILFTHKDSKEGQSLENLISSRDENVKKYIAECGNRCLAFNNKAKGAEREYLVAELMTMIDDLVQRNRNAPCYREDMMNYFAKWARGSWGDCWTEQMRLSCGRNDDPLSELSGASLSSCKSFGGQVSHLSSCRLLFHAGVTLWLSSEGSDDADGSLEGGREGERETGTAVNAQAQPRDRVELLGKWPASSSWISSTF
ncbi:hypothetical protein E2320_022819 [Naja naja]|nr:hypothetical protein E2320_022819 [Naja naja]